MPEASPAAPESLWEDQSVDTVALAAPSRSTGRQLRPDRGDVELHRVVGRYPRVAQCRRLRDARPVRSRDAGTDGDRFSLLDAPDSQLIGVQNGEGAGELVGMPVHGPDDESDLSVQRFSRQPDEQDSVTCEPLPEHEFAEVRVEGHEDGSFARCQSQYLVVRHAGL